MLKDDFYRVEKVKWLVYPNKNDTMACLCFEAEVHAKRDDIDLIVPVPSSCQLLESDLSLDLESNYPKANYKDVRIVKKLDHPDAKTYPKTFTFVKLRLHQGTYHYRCLCIMTHIYKTTFLYVPAANTTSTILTVNTRNKGTVTDHPYLGPNSKRALGKKYKLETTKDEKFPIEWFYDPA